MKPKISDFILIGLLFIGVIIYAIFTYIPKEPNVDTNNPPIVDSNNDLTTKRLYCVIEVDNELVGEIDFTALTEETTYTYNGLYTEIVIKADNQGVWVSKSGCRTQQCVKHKKITKLDEVILCAYNMTEVRIIER